MSYSVSYRMATGGSSRVVETAKQVVSAHLELVLAGASSIVIRNAENIIVTLTSVSALALRQV